MESFVTFMDNKGKAVQSDLEKHFMSLDNHFITQKGGITVVGKTTEVYGSDLVASIVIPTGSTPKRSVYKTLNVLPKTKDHETIRNEIKSGVSSLSPSKLPIDDLNEKVLTSYTTNTPIKIVEDEILLEVNDTGDEVQNGIVDATLVETTNKDIMIDKVTSTNEQLPDLKMENNDDDTLSMKSTLTTGTFESTVNDEEKLSMVNGIEKISPTTIPGGVETNHTSASTILRNSSRENYPPNTNGSNSSVVSVSTTSKHSGGGGTSMIHKQSSNSTAASVNSTIASTVNTSTNVIPIPGGSKISRITRKQTNN